MKVNKKQKNLIKIYITSIVLIFLIVNWDGISWIFNYEEISGFAYDVFHPNQDVAILGSKEARPTSAPNGTTIQKEDSIEIPAIGLVSSLVVGQGTDNAVLKNDLDKGVVYYPGSSFPGQTGQTIILGHSAPPNWPHIKHDWVFSNLGKLKVGDEIFVYFNGKKYVYQIKDTSIIARGGEIPYNTNGNTLVLISCWPPGKNYQRIAVQAKLIN